MMKIWLMPLAAGLVLGGCSNGQESAEQAAGGPEQIATIHDIMADVVMPQTDIVWNATAILSDETGVHDMRPRTDDDWEKLRAAALILAEAQNLLVMPGRKVLPDGDSLEGGGTLTAEQIARLIGDHREDFVQNAGAMQKLARQAIQNIDDRDLDALDKTGGQIDQVCESCHLEFWYPPEATPK